MANTVECSHIWRSDSDFMTCLLLTAVLIARGLCVVRWFSPCHCESLCNLLLRFAHSFFPYILSKFLHQMAKTNRFKWRLSPWIKGYREKPISKHKLRRLKNEQIIILKCNFGYGFLSPLWCQLKNGLQRSNDVRNENICQTI